MNADLIRAAARNHRSWMASKARATGGRAWREAGLVCAYEPIHGELTIAFPRSIRPDSLRPLVTAVRPRITGCWFSGLYEPKAAERALAAAGFCEGWEPHWMAGRAAVGAAPDPRIERATAVPEYDAYGQALLTMSRSRHYTARVDGRIVGFAWLHVTNTTAGLYDVEVWEHRRTGLGSALTQMALADAAALGHEHVVLNATPDGTALYGSLGFRSLGHGKTWWRHEDSNPVSEARE